MLQLQKTFRYDGDVKELLRNNPSLKTLVIEFSVPKYTIAPDSELGIAKTITGAALISQTIDLDKKEFAVIIPVNSIWDSDLESPLFYMPIGWILRLLGKTKTIAPGEPDFVKICDYAAIAITANTRDKAGNIISSSSFSALPLLSIKMFEAENNPQSHAVDPMQILGSNLSLINYGVLRSLIAGESEQKIKAFIHVLSVGLDTRGTVVRLLPEEEISRTVTAHLVNNNMAMMAPANIFPEEYRQAYALIKEKFDLLFDFPIIIPELQVLEVAGNLRLLSGEAAVGNDFFNYNLSIEYKTASNDPKSKSTTVDYRWDFKPGDIQDNAVAFAFSKIKDFRPAKNLVQSAKVKVKGLDGAVLWEQTFAGDDEALQHLQIELPLQRWGKTIEPDGTTINSPGKMGKKLRGKAIAGDEHCQVANLNIVLQGKESENADWKTLGVATTDNTGNFSMNYPPGDFVAARAFVATMPDSPAPVAIVNRPGQSIADDFIFLMIQSTSDYGAKDDKGDDCDCHAPKKANRLPDQEDLISSDAYTQDIGGACVNLSTPNRTLSEYPFTAAVRTSDPDVANYVLRKSEATIGASLLKVEQYELLPYDGEKVERKPVDFNNPVRWQDDPEDADENLSFYQAVTVATGHLLRFKNVVKADGYSLGDLLYSLPLAPGQKKQIVIFEQKHSLQGSESQTVGQGERLSASLLNERGITDIMNGNVSESVRGSSRAQTGGFSIGGGLGFIGKGFAGVFGASGGSSTSSSSAQQDSARNVSMAFGEKLRHEVTQSAQSYREMNASVITTVTEGQQYSATTEVVANHNHCHALTMMYFEVLRHYAIFQEIANVEECLFVPLLMTRFDHRNVFKFRDVLAESLLFRPSVTYLTSFDGQNPLIKGFDALQRVVTNYEHVDYPGGAYCDEAMNFITGELFVRTNIQRPKTRYDRILSWPLVETTMTLETYYSTIQLQFSFLSTAEIANEYISVDANFKNVPPANCIRIKKFDDNFFEDEGNNKGMWNAIATLFNKHKKTTDFLNAYFSNRTIAEWDGIFYSEIAPVLFEHLVKQLRLSPFKLQFTSLHKYKGGEQVMRINFRGSAAIPRSDVHQVNFAVTTPWGFTGDFVTLIVENAEARYSTSHFEGILFSGYAGDNLLGEGTPILTNLKNEEKRTPRTEDAYLVKELITHLNSNLEYYNKALWANLDPDRRYMLLDGFHIQTYSDDNLPDRVRSLASVVKNELIGFAGNSLIFPVSSGFKVDRSFVVSKTKSENGVEILNQKSLLDHYKPLTPIPPYRISIPTKGVFCEAVQGACNACEKIEDQTRLQDWTRFPNPDEPTAINALTPPVPQITDWKANYKDLATPMINIQNAPAEPTPGAGFAGLAELLGKSDTFRDAMGLAGNQENAMKTYLSNQENAKAFAQMAKELTVLGHNTKNSDKIVDAINNSPLSDKEKAELIKEHLKKQIGMESGEKPDASTHPNNNPAVKKAADLMGKADVKVSTTDDKGNKTDVETKAIKEGLTDSPAKMVKVAGKDMPILKQPTATACWATVATMMLSWRDGKIYTIEEALAKAGQMYVDKYIKSKSGNDTGLTSEEKPAFIKSLGMVAEEAPINHDFGYYANLLKKHGPIWLTTDAKEKAGQFSPHARILVDVEGNGLQSPSNFIFVNPSMGEKETEDFDTFLKKYEQMLTDNKGAAFKQVVYFEEKVGSSGHEGEPGEGGITPLSDDECKALYDKPTRNLTLAEGINLFAYLLRTDSNNIQISKDNSGLPESGQDASKKVLDTLKNPEIRESKKGSGSSGMGTVPQHFRLTSKINNIRFVVEINPANQDILDNVTPKICIILYKLTKWLSSQPKSNHTIPEGLSRWGVSKIYHLGIGHGQGGIFDRHNIGNSCDFSGVEGVKDTPYTFKVNKDWSAKGNDKAVNQTEWEKHYKNGSYRLSKNDAAFQFFKELYRFLLNEASVDFKDPDVTGKYTKSELDQKDLNENRVSDKNQICHPDHPSHSLAKSHWNHVHFEIGLDGKKVVMDAKPEGGGEGGSNTPAEGGTGSSSGLPENEFVAFINEKKKVVTDLMKDNKWEEVSDRMNELWIRDMVSVVSQLHWDLDAGKKPPVSQLDVLVQHFDQLKSDAKPRIGLAISVLHDDPKFIQAGEDFLKKVIQGNDDEQAKLVKFQEAFRGQKEEVEAFRKWDTLSLNAKQNSFIGDYFLKIRMGIPLMMKKEHRISDKSFDLYWGKTEPTPGIIIDQREKQIWEELRTEGSYASINTGDNMSFTWGKGLAKESVEQTLKHIFQKNKNIQTDFSFLGLSLNAKGVLQVFNTNNLQIETGDAAYSAIASNAKLLDFFLFIAFIRKEEILNGQWEFIKTKNLTVFDFCKKQNWGEDASRLLFHFNYWTPKYVVFMKNWETIYQDTKGVPENIIFKYASLVVKTVFYNALVEKLRKFANNALNRYALTDQPTAGNFLTITEKLKDGTTKDYYLISK